MTSQQLDNRSQGLEARVAALESELAQLKQLLAGLLEQEEQETPWWMKVAGSFENDPTFDEAVRLGQEWRQSIE
ncbi:MAG: hypothetical protein RID53_04615 [Coleofasciculus sp. B1-GNL1-01]|uniref:hypothetical protein n=1 Tax=Coleofasciculus sp. B1-GNL1-01 TaxID=3068484 RepID=UPI0033043BCF